MPLYAEIKLFELFGVDLAGGIGHEALSSLGLGECDDVPDVLGSGQQHYEPVEAEGYAAVRRGAVFEGLEEEAESLLCLSGRYVEQVEDLLLDLGIVDTNASA